MTVQANPAVSDPNPDNLEDENPTVLVNLGDEPAKPAPVAVEATDDDGVYEYDKTGDVGLDMALSFIGKAGLSTDHPAMVAAQAGDFSLLKATLASKGVQGWEQYVALGEQAFAKSQTKIKDAAEAVSKMCVAEAGGAEEWAEVRKWAGENATPEEKAEINAMLNKGGFQAKTAVKYLVASYNKVANPERTPADPTANAGRSNAPATGKEPLAPKAYAEAVRVLSAQLNGRLEGSPQYDALQQRRRAWRE
jgi:hypothetical protein